MLAIALVVLAAATPHTYPFEITSNKPFVRATVDGSEPLWFILDSGNNGPSLIANECADRLKIQRGNEEQANVGAGSGADVRIATVNHPVTFQALGETLTVADPRILTLEHVSRIEGRRVDGLLGSDFLGRHVLQLDYAKKTITVHDPNSYAPPAGALVVPITTDTGWPIAEGTLTPPGREPIPCRILIDTGVRTAITFYRPFSERKGLYDMPRSLHDVTTGGGAGGVSRGDVGRLDVLTLGPAKFENVVATFSRDTRGLFATDYPDAILGGEILKRHRVTFDYPHDRMILEPYGVTAPFEYDMSGLFLGTDGPDYRKIRIQAVNPGTPSADAGLQEKDEIVSIDGRRTPKLSLDEARALLRVPKTRQLEIRRDGKVMTLRLEARRLV